MKKMILIGGVAFVVSVGAAVGVRLLFFPPIVAPPVAADSTGVALEHDLTSVEDTAGQEEGQHAEPDSQPRATELPGGVAALKALQDAVAEAETERAVRAEPHDPAAISDTVDTADADRSLQQAAAEGQGSAPPVERPSGTTVEKTRSDGSEYKTLAKILATMKTSDAVKILAHLDDDQVEGILRSMQVRQIATLLAKLPTERAAELGQRLVDDREGEES